MEDKRKIFYQQKYIYLIVMLIINLVHINLDLQEKKMDIMNIKVELLILEEKNIQVIMR